VAVAAALALQPKILVLDEPTSQLDPGGAEEVLTALTRLNEDLGLTIILAEHRLERVIAHADHLRVLFGPGIEPLAGSPRNVLARLDATFVPPLALLGRRFSWEPLPLTIKEGRDAVHREHRRPAAPPPDPLPSTGPAIIQLERVTADYGRDRVLHDLDFAAGPGELVGLMGRNGSGKTTLLRLVIGLHRPRAGRVRVCGRDTAHVDPAALAQDVGYVPQHPGAILFAETLRDELAFTLKHRRNSGLDADELLAALGLTHLADRERAALAAILVGAPRILLLDEPTRGMDVARKRALGDLLTRLRTEGVTILLATHDVEWVAQIATRVVLLGDGRIVADGGPRQVLAGSLTFATQINKLYGAAYLTVDDIIADERHFQD
jgi:energy-coupling factor transport system ATP-binding protein